MNMLSEREVEILQKASEGYRYEDVAAELHLPVQTVKRGAANLFQKLGADNIHHAVGIAFRRGILK